MDITISSLCNVANALTINSEPYSWFDQVFEQGLIHFENQNTSEQFSLPLNAQPVEKKEHAYAFFIDSLKKTVWLEFFRHVPLTEQDL